MDEMLETIKRKLPNLSNMDVEMLRSIFTNYCVNLICDNKLQAQIFESAKNPRRRRSNSKTGGFEAGLMPESPLSSRRRGRPRRNTIPAVPLPTPKPLDADDLF